MRRPASGDDDPVPCSLFQKYGAIVGDETAALGLALPEMRVVHVEPSHLLGAYVESLRGLGDQLVTGLEPITEFPRRELAELDTSAAYLLRDRDNRHAGSPNAILG